MAKKKLTQKKVSNIDSWIIVSIVLLLFFGLFVIYPMISLVQKSFLGADGAFSTASYLKFFQSKTNLRALYNSFETSIVVTIISLIVGTPLAYFMTCYKVKGASILRVFIILSSMSAPFVGAYAWIVLLGNNGMVRNFLTNYGVSLPSIYGFNGIVFVMALNMFTLVYLYVSGALQNLDNTLLEASENLGTYGISRFLKIVVPLCMPTILAAALLVFMRAFADFGTPLLLGMGKYTTFPVLIYNEYVGEVSSDKAFASALSVIAIVVTTIVFLIQKYVNSKFTFTMNALHPIEQKQAKPISNIFIHLYCYLVTFIAFSPQIYVIYSSFQNTSGKIFVEGFSLESFKYVLKRYPKSIPNTFKVGIFALLLVILVSILIAYLVVRRKNIFNSTLDILTMIPYIIPGSVIGVALIVAFNKRVLFLPTLTGTTAIMVIALIIRRSPYTIRSSVATLQQIPLTIEEASISLGASKVKTFLTITFPMMINGVISGAILSWVSIITELSTALYLYTTKSITMTLTVYVLVSRGSYGYAAAEATLLTACTIISLLVYTVVTKGKGSGIA